MKIRAKQLLVTSYGILNAGDEADIPTEIAVAWIKAGLAEKISDVPGPKEKKHGKKDTGTAS